MPIAFPAGCWTSTPPKLEMFLAFGLVALRQFIDATGAEVRSPADLWA